MSPNFSCLQAQKSPTFSRPPLDGSLSVPEIYDYHLQNSGTHPLFVYDRDDVIHTITWAQAGRAIHLTARMLRLMTPLQPVEDVPVIAILAAIDQISYFALTAGIMRAGYRAFPISPRNSDRAVAHLIQEMQVHHLVVSRDEAMQTLAKAACQLVEGSETGFQVHLLDAPTFEVLFSDNDLSFTPLPPMEKQNVHNVTLILHSSGSTSFPKPIILTHRNLIQWGTQPYYGETDLCGLILSNHSLPFFHAMGVVSMTWATMTGVTISNFAPRDPPAPVTPETLYRSAVACQSHLIFCVPTFLEEWSQNPEKLLELQKFNAIMFGGAPLQKSVGDMLSGLGIHIYPFYGATELGGISWFLPKTPPTEGWEYFKLSPHAEPIFLDAQVTEGVFRLLLKTTPCHTPAVTNIVHDGTKAYDSNDLVIRHPENSALMKIYGRADDQIMHSTGEKTNPVPMETIINRHPMIQSSVMFGRGHFQAGLLVEPRPEYAFDPSELGKLTAFRDTVWSSIEEANNFGPTHSRIFKEMILVAHPSKPFLYTPKGTPRRQLIINEYEAEIEEGYRSLEISLFTPISPPRSLEFEDILVYVSQLLQYVMGKQVKENDDLFNCGCDSLKATRVRSHVLRTLQEMDIDTHAIPPNFVYLYSTSRRLARYITSAAHGCSSDFVQQAIDQMNDLVKKYTQNYIQHVPLIKTPDEETILLTGSTGGLGSYLLEELILDDNVFKIYCLIRKAESGQHFLDKQKLAFHARGIDTDLLLSPKLVFVEGDASSPLLGLSDAVYEELRTSITSIMHVAWHVDFNVSISSMEPFIAGTRTMIDLCLSSYQARPPRLVFASSIGVTRNWKNGRVPEILLPDAAMAVGSGYPESKWVAEQILQHAAQWTSLKPIIVRIGQLSGGRNGFWRLNEWVPSVVQTARILECLPNTPGGVSWIPVQIAAQAFVKMRYSPYLVLHLVHPQPTTWNCVFDIIAQELKVPLVPYPEWLRRLEAWENASPSTKTTKVSSIQLLDFYRSANKPLASVGGEAFGFPRLSTTQAEQVVPILSSMRQLNKADISSWLRYWSFSSSISPQL